jgi:hypothetical protein
MKSNQDQNRSDENKIFSYNEQIDTPRGISRFKFEQEDIDIGDYQIDQA